MRRERMSRPSSSVPAQWADEGDDRRTGRSMWAGSWGAIHGAKTARVMKITTRTAPVVARTLWRAARGSEMGAVDMGQALKTIKSFNAEFAEKSPGGRRENRVPLTGESSD